MNQAAAMKLQQEVKGKEQELEQSYVRMERGEPPNEEAEREWLRMVRDEARREKELVERKEVNFIDHIPPYCLCHAEITKFRLAYSTLHRQMPPNIQEIKLAILVKF